jgi:hypothetical protein
VARGRGHCSPRQPRCVPSSSIFRRRLTRVLADDVFLTLYRELYFRHVYARLQPDLDDRFHSYDNYCSLFNLILNSPGPVPLSLPIDWLYNM